MKTTVIRFSLVFATLAQAAALSAASIPFNESFDDDAAGGTMLNWDQPSTSGWDVTGGTVDLIHDTGIPTDDFLINCMGGANSGGGCIDLDGSTFNSGVLQTLSSDSFTLVAGQPYQLSAYISGNQLGGTSDDVLFGLRDTSNGLSLADLLIEDILSTAAFTLYTVLFQPAVDVSAQIFFTNAGGRDNIGPILDNVTLAAVPIPPAGWLLISGLIGLLGVARRRDRADA